ncbi:MAG: hypothetical protein KIT22_08325, partial [Verrucomicrobiae bacterium]|nr:hypothetical protein [Verrucomicrobiae bacterium]
MRRLAENFLSRRDAAHAAESTRASRVGPGALAGTLVDCSSPPALFAATRGRIRSARSLANLFLTLLLLAPVPQSPAVASAPSAGATNAALAEAFALRRFEWIPPFQTPRTLLPLLPQRFPLSAVRDLEIAGQRLWASVQVVGQSNTPPQGGRLWIYQDAVNYLEPTTGPLEQHSILTLFGREDALWLGINGGIAGLDLNRNQIVPFGPPQGMTSTNIVGIGLVEATVVALGHWGWLWGLPPGATNFVRASAAAPSASLSIPEAWIGFVTSGDWMLAVGSEGLAARHHRSSQWVQFRAELENGSPFLTPPRLACAVGDGDGGFWVGSDAGLHWINPESNLIENRFWTPVVTVPGGLGMAVAPGFQPTAAAYAMAQERVMEGIRDRMRDRARQARNNLRLQHPVSPYWPSSRMPGAVTALHRDGNFLWVATRDGASVLRSRVLLMHQPTRRWVGWFPVAAPITCFASDEQRLWIGCDISRSPGASAVFAAERLPLIAVPQGAWVKDAIPPAELTGRLAALPVKERAVLAFFGADPAQVVELLAPAGEAGPDADAETLFLLAFAHDAVGLNRPDLLDHYVDRLRVEHPESSFTELAASVRSARPAALNPGESAEPSPAPSAEPPETAATPAASVPPAEDSALATQAAAVMSRQDLSGDGGLNPVEFRLWRGLKADFAAADLDHNGQLDLQEIERLLAAEAPD